MDAIAHIALPILVSDGREPSAFIDPVVQCMRTVLASALLHRARVRRVFITSSAAALRGADPEGRTSTTLDEGSWNDFSVQYCEEKGAAAEPLHKYRAGKVLAERAAWAFYERAERELGARGETLGWDMTVFCPPSVFGPPMHEVPSVETSVGSLAQFYRRVVKEETRGTGVVFGCLTTFGCVVLHYCAVRMNGSGCSHNGVTRRFWMVDVRDLARAFVLGLQKEEAGGERFVIGGFPGTWQDISKWFHAPVYPVR